MKIFFAIAAILLLLLIVGLGFTGFLCVINLILHSWNWTLFVVAVVSSSLFLATNKYWRKRQLKYAIPSEFRLFDALWSIASLFGSLFLMYLLRFV